MLRCAVSAPALCSTTDTHALSLALSLARSLPPFLGPPLSLLRQDKQSRRCAYVRCVLRLNGWTACLALSPPPPPCIGAITGLRRSPPELGADGDCGTRGTAPVRSLCFPCWDPDVAALVCYNLGQSKPRGSSRVPLAASGTHTSRCPLGIRGLNIKEAWSPAQLTAPSQLQHKKPGCPLHPTQANQPTRRHRRSTGLA